MSLEKIKTDRLKKLEAIKKVGINPYPAKTGARIFIDEAISNFDDFEKSKKEVGLAGRLRSLRVHGGSTFANIQDVSGQIQLYFKKDELGQNDYDFFAKNFDVGDFIGFQANFLKLKKASALFW